MANKKKVKKKRANKYNEKLKLNTSFEQAVKTLVSSPKPSKKDKQK